MKRKLPKEPSALGMIFTAISGISLGILLGAFILIKEPPRTVRNQSSESENEQLGKYATYYIPGAAASSESATIRSRISRLARQVPGAIPFTEMEINHYFSQRKSAETDAEGNPADISFASPNVRIENDQFVLSSKIVLNPTKDRFEIIAQAIGHFENGSNGVNLKVEKLYLNSLVLPKFGGFIEELFQGSISAIPLPTEVSGSLGAIKEVELLEDQIVLAL
jgi:hypothetical protein